jgi:hypothetical protein
MSTRLVDPVHFFNARGFSVMTEDAYLARIKELETQLAKSQADCRTLAIRLKRIAEANGVAK